ncbi:MAG: DUF6445 family protein [Pseudomonadota bacterium]
MHLKTVIIDDFFDRPLDVRKQILAMSYPPRPENAYYPGRNAAQPFPMPGIEGLVSQIVQEPLKPVPFPKSSHCIPRIALDGDQRGSSVHVDFCHWSGIIYLTLDEHCQGGTHIFTHKATGWDTAPVWPGMAEAAGYANADEALQTILETDNNDRSKWEETMMVPMKFNRLVLFRGYIWHDAGVSFGTSPENGRLILPIFFENTNPN